MQQPNIEHTFPSTTWEWKKVKMSGSHPAEGSAAKPLVSASAPSRLQDRRREFTLHVLYRGGPESSWLVRYGNLHLRAPGWMALEDVMSRFEEHRRRQYESR